MIPSASRTSPAVGVDVSGSSQPRQAAEQAIISRLRAFLQENFLYQRPADFQLHDDDRLLERGVIDSMGVVEMISFIEDSFSIKVSEDEISEANLGSLSAIAQYVVAKQPARTW